MISRILISLFIFSFSVSKVNAQYFTLKGKVTNSSLEPIAYVNVSVVDHSIYGTSTNLKGEYSMQIRPGSYVLVYSFIGFKTIKIPVTINNRNVTQNVILEVADQELEGVTVTNKKTDRSEEIIRKVIANKHKYGNPAPYTVNAYIKATQKETIPKKRKDTAIPPPEMNMAEIYMTLNASPPDKIKEEVTGSDIKGDKDGLFYLSHSDGEFNWYRNLLEIPALSESPILSPVSNSGLIAYKYRMLGSYYENNHKYYRIKVTPGIMGNALVSGEMVIMDSAWCIISLKLYFPKYHMTEYDVFEINQQYTLQDSNYFLEKQEFNYTARFGRSKSSGRTVVYYSNYKFNHQFKKKFFNNEISSTSQQAYERDSGFWFEVRKEPLTKEEIDFIRKSDSTKAVQSQKHWQDSADKVFNQITLKKLFLTGQNHFNRSRETYWSFKPLVFVYLPIFIAGPRVSYWVNYERTFRNKKNIIIMPDISYGIYNNDLKGSFSVSRLYNPFNRATIEASIERDFDFINNFASWVNIFGRANFFIKDAVSLSHRMELLNGLFFSVGGEYANRKSLQNYEFMQVADTVFGVANLPVEFEPYKALTGIFSLSYTPFQKYIREPYQKLILGSRWPTFSAIYKKGINGLGCTTDFDYLEFRIEQEFKIGLLGVSKFNIASGEFLTHNDLRQVDFKYQRNAGPIFYTNPLQSFQGIDTTYTTIKRFYEAHYFHRFNGSILNKIPVIKKLNLIECAGVGLLYTHERNMKYAEFSFGVEKVVRFWKERIKFGVFYVMAVNNIYSYRSQFKFTFDLYSNRYNRFSY